MVCYQYSTALKYSVWFMPSQLMRLSWPMIHGLSHDTSCIGLIVSSVLQFKKLMDKLDPFEDDEDGSDQEAPPPAPPTSTSFPEPPAHHQKVVFMFGEKVVYANNSRQRTNVNNTPEKNSHNAARKNVTSMIQLLIKQDTYTHLSLRRGQRTLP